jgi:hypothetical protein
MQICGAGFQTCRIADFQIGGPSAGWDTCGTADLEVCATTVDAFHRALRHFVATVLFKPL